MATNKEIDNFIRELKGKINVFDIAFHPERENTQTGLGIPFRINLILKETG